MAVSSRLYQVLKLTDRRQIGFAEFGCPTGKPVFYLHGTPSSRLEVGMWEPLCSKLGICMVVPDRPGMGLSTFVPGRQILDYSKDVERLAEHLNWNTFSILGGSGGAPYVLSCARNIPTQALKAIGIIAGSGPPQAGSEGLSMVSRLAERTIWRWPRLMTWLLDRSEAKAAQNQDPAEYGQYIRRQYFLLNEADRAACEHDFEWIVRGGREAYKGGSSGAAWDLYLMSQSWGFDISEVKKSGIMLWCGTQDRNTPLAMSRYMASKLREAQLREMEGLTHYTIFLATNVEEILNSLISAA